MDETMRDRDLPEAMKPADVGSFIDEVGHRYGKLTVIARNGTKRRAAAWKCLCDCGAETTAAGRAAVRGNRAAAAGAWLL